MAEAEEGKETQKEEAGAAPTAKKRGRSKMVLIAVVVLVVGGLGGGAFFFLKKSPPKESAAPQQAEAKETRGNTEGGSNQAGAIFDLDPFVVNLADSAELRYLKVTIKLELAQPTFKQDVEGHIPQIRDNLLVLLSSKEYASIRTVEGKMDLRAEIIQRLNAVLQGDKVTNAYFTEFVAQ